ncbi:MAG: C10 family peptidase [Muribaculaceae bacterium]|nr:C10 family peptidase [Muribaculaceae bacterium]
MKKTIITLAAATLAATGAVQAKSLSPAEALRRALASEEAPAAVSQMKAPARVEASITLNQLQSDEPALYVISRGEGRGFVVVSADDVAAPLLGYSDNDLDLNNLPDNFRWWLSQYQAEISAGISQGATTYEAPAAANYPAIEPLCTTKWDQDSPYNNLSPRSGGRATYAGCVAVAMAQVLKYHNYPEKGIGTHSYRWGTERLSFDYANTTFEWDKMLNTYRNGAGTAEERNAVATLLYGCAVGVDMNFGTNASGAQSSAVPAAIRDYFGYDKSISMAVRTAYSSEEWAEMIYDQLFSVGPIYYSGRGESGGHAFVCDGYNNGLFHFNWGWNGISDGYYRLTRLVPGTQGIGGNSDGFNTDQTIILNIRKPKEGSELPAPYVMCTQPLSATFSGTNTTFPGPFMSYTPYDFSGRLALRIYNWDTNEYIRSYNAASSNWKPGNGYRNVSFIMSGLAEGHYRGELTILYNNEYYPIHHITLDTGSFEITRTSSTMTFEPILAGNLKWGTLELNSPMYSNKLFGLALPYTYDGEKDIWYQLTPRLLSNGTIVATGELYNALITPGSGVVDYSGQWLNNVPNGDYELVLVDGNGKTLGSLNVTVTTYSGSSAGLISLTSANWSMTSTDIDNLVIDATATGTFGYFAGSISARIFEKGNSTTPLAQLDSRPIFLNKGDSKNFTISGPFYEGTPGQMYDISLYNGNSRLSGPKEFTLSGSNTAIDDVIAAEEEAPVEYFNLQGQPVSNPAAGSIVIRRQGDKVEKILVK